MSIKATHKAITRHTTYAAKLRTNEEEERNRNFREVQDQCPTVKLIEVTSSKELLRTTERCSLFDGPWLQGSSFQDLLPSHTQVWKRKGGAMKPIGRAIMDVTGMLDTARYIVWADISAKTPTLEEDAEIALLRKARLWHESTTPTELINPNPERKTHTLEEHRPKNRFTPTIPQTSQLATRPPPPAKLTPKGIEDKSNGRHTRGKALLDTFSTNASPTSVTTHLSTFDNIEELARITECLLQGTYEIDQYDSLHHAHTILKLQNASDSVLNSLYFCLLSKGVSNFEFHLRSR
jgi:hypothetical protein